MKTARQHILDIKDEKVKEKCLANLDERCADELCSYVGYALMLGVNQPAWEKDFWQEAYWTLRKEEPDYMDHSEHYPNHAVMMSSDRLVHLGIKK